MTTQEQISAVASHLSDARLEELLDFARFLRLQDDRNEWRSIAQTQFAKAYGPEEPGYYPCRLENDGETMNRGDVLQSRLASQIKS